MACRGCNKAKVAARLDKLEDMIMRMLIDKEFKSNLELEWKRYLASRE
jgi:hypothetical protein